MTPTHTFIVICEGMLDQQVSAQLTARTLMGLADWLTTDSLRFRGLVENEQFSTWAGIKGRGDVPKRKGFKDAGWGPDSETARRALHLAGAETVDGVILLRDSDRADAGAKRAELAAAVAAFRTTEVAHPLSVAAGVATAKIESWLLAAQTPDAEKLALLRQQLGFDPTMAPEELTAKDEPGAKRSAKAVLEQLATVDDALEALESASHEVLLRNGRNAGLPEFLCEVRCGFGPLTGHVPNVPWCRCP